MWLMDFDKTEYHEEFYIHCVQTLARTIKKETGSKAESLQDVWDNYMFYPFEKCKAKEVLSDATVQTGKAVRS